MPATIEVTGERAIAVRLEALTVGVRRRLHDALENSILPALAARQRAAAPRGKTGRLAASVGHVFVDETENAIRGVVTVVASSGWQYAKAGALEYGAPGRHGRFQVRAHQRSHPSGPTVMVRRYDRTQRLIAARYLRGPFEAMQGEIVDELQGAVDAAVAAADAA